MTAWPSEAAAIGNMIARFGDGAFACVMDSYDYAAALAEVLPAVAAQKVRRAALCLLCCCVLCCCVLCAVCCVLCAVCCVLCVLAAGCACCWVRAATHTHTTHC